MQVHQGKRDKSPMITILITVTGVALRRTLSEENAQCNPSRTPHLNWSANLGHLKQKDCLLDYETT